MTDAGERRRARQVTAAPAKLNLFLHVLRRRADGYHDLQTLFQLVDLCDTVHVVATDDGSIARDPPPTDPVLAALDPDADLTVRAAKLLKDASGTPLGAHLYIEKRIPSGGGLGGGSSDAATVLLALNQRWNLNWPRERLAELGLQLGADVPLFVLGRTAWGEGRGERLTPVALPSRWFLIVHPRVSVSTALVFQAPELTRDTPAITLDEYLHNGGHNDCEPVVRRRHPEVAAALDWLSGHAPALLTGTGSCIFAAFATEADARRVAQLAPSRWSCFIARGLDRSPD